ncbi:MAG: FRG domain-containing protein [Deltaproteobacteria bacterium]|nr:FRG domain-containing protein [Deltaproteobacteria bacterium]
MSEKETAFNKITEILSYVMGEKLNNWKATYPKFPHGIWFRGEPEGDTPLTPSVFRKKDNGHQQYYFDDERKMFTDANLKLFGDTRFVIDKLCMMQHHKLPTRLLDWTENILYALFFAVDNKDDKNAKLYILNASRLNGIVEDDVNACGIYQPSSYQVALRANIVRADWFMPILAKTMEELSLVERDNLLKRLSIKFGNVYQFYKCIYDNTYANNFTICRGKYNNNELLENESYFRDYLSKPIAFTPIYNHQRMYSQQSVFTIHGGAIEQVESAKINKPISIIDINKDLKKDSGDEILVEIDIDKSLKKEIKKALVSLGIHRGSIYLDKDNQTAQIKEFWERD